MSAWNLVYDAWDPDEQPLREALCVVANGFFATRGAAEDARAGGPHYPGTYIAGAYNRLTSKVADRDVENEDLVNWPNWLPVRFRHVDGDWIEVGESEILDYWQDLDLRRGVLERRVKFRDSAGRASSIHTRRFAHMRRRHLAALEWKLIPEDWSGRIVIRSEIDGDVSNSGVERYSDLRGDHVEALESQREGDEIVWLTSQSSASLMRVAQAARHRLVMDGVGERIGGEAVIEERRVGHEFGLDAGRGRPIRLEKIVSLYTIRDHAISEPSLDARTSVRRAGDFEELLHSHQQQWDRLWENCDIVMEGAGLDERIQMILRLHCFHLLQTTAIHTVDLDVGVPARGWHGEAYRGHIFWDELFIFPYLTLRLPEVTRMLLMYRYRRLDEAKWAAAKVGRSGAMFPWQSGSSGREETQKVHLNPNSGRWNPDTTHLQRHINAAIVYNIWEYHQATNDDEFLSFYGAEMILEIARFWYSSATWNEERERFEILGVVGPDEYHTAYPDSDEPGLKNNAYTNVMAAWSIRCALRVFEALPNDRGERLRHELGISDEERRGWERVASRMYVPFHDEGVISQFEGYEELEEFDWAGYREKYGDIQRLDRILEAENDSPNRFKASKQADVLMLFYLFSSDELVDLFEGMGYEFDPVWIPKMIEYYEGRTSHGSTLSRVVHAWVLARSQREASWKFFEEALRSDIDDIQGGTTSEGIHLGAMAGSVDIVQRCYTGIELRDDALHLTPQLPEPLSGVRLIVRYHGHTLRIFIERDGVEISSCRGGPQPVRVVLCGERFEVCEGQTYRVKC